MDRKTTVWSKLTRVAEARTVTALIVLFGVGTGVNTTWAQDAKPAASDKAAAPAKSQDPASADKSKNSVELVPIKAPPANVLKAAKQRSKAKPAVTTTPTGPVTGAPAIRIAETVHDFGESWTGGTLDHVFQIKNEGDQVLKLLSVKPSCGCTVAKGYDKEIPPGGTGKIPVSLNTKKVRNKFTKNITVNSNDPATASLRLQITGIVKSYVDVAPRTIALGHIKEGDQATKSCKLLNNTDGMIELKLEQAKSGPFTAELVERVPGKEFQLKVTAAPPFKPKLNNGKFIITTNVPKQPRIEVPVTAYVPARLDLRPETLVLPSSNRNEQKRLIKFTNNGEKPVKVLSASVSDDTIAVEVIERSAGKAYDIKVTIPAGYKTPKDAKIITLVTDDSEKKEINIPIKGRPVKKRPAESLLGTISPTAEFTTRAGVTINTGSKLGKITVLDFFASWCGYCKKQIPQVSTMYTEKFKDNPNVQFIGVSADILKTEGVTNPRARTLEQVDGVWAKASSGAFELALDPNGNTKKLFKVSSYPTLMLLNKDGKVEAVHFGAKADLPQILAGQIEKLLAGKSLVSSGPTPVAKPQPTPKPTVVTVKGTADAAPAEADKIKENAQPEDSDATSMANYSVKKRSKVD